MVVEALTMVVQVTNEPFKGHPQNSQKENLMMMILARQRKWTLNSWSGAAACSPNSETIVVPKSTRNSDAQNSALPGRRRVGNFARGKANPAGATRSGGVSWSKTSGRELPVHWAPERGGTSRGLSPPPRGS